MTDLDVRAKRYALKLLSYRGRSIQEMGERLRGKGIPDAVIDSTIRHLKEAGLLNDLEHAEILGREALTRRMLSRSGARCFMLKRGIPRSIADAVIGGAENTDYDNAVRIVEKKLRVLARYPAMTVRRRIYNVLARKGYAAETITKALKAHNLKEVER